MICSSLYSIEKKTIQVKVINDQTVDLCGTQFEKEVRFYIYLGNINPNDSLLGYNLKINYDPTVIRMNSFLKYNTLTSFFDFSDYRIVQNEGYIECSAGQVSNFFTPVFGDKALVAFAGTFIGNCKNSTIVSVEYIEFTEEFQCKLDTVKPYINTLIDAVVQNKPDRKITILSNTDTTLTVKDSITEIKYNLTAKLSNKIDSIKFNYSIDSKNLEYVGLRVSPDSLFEISSLDIISKNNISFVLSRKTNIELYKLDVFIKVKSIVDSSYECKTKFNIKNVNECACVTVLDSSLNYIKSIKNKVDLDVKEIPDVKYFNIIENKIVLNENCIGYNVEIIDYLGKVLFNEYCNHSYVIDLKNFSQIVFMRISNESVFKSFKIKID